MQQAGTDAGGVRANSDHNTNPHDNNHATTSSPSRINNGKARRPSNKARRPSNKSKPSDREQGNAYYDSRAATQTEFNRRASTLQTYYFDHPELLPQLPFTFRHGYKRWRLGGYIALMVFDACLVPILLYYAMTFGGHLEGWITFAVITAIWGGPTYIEFAIRSFRIVIIKQARFYKPLGANNRWAFDITNWIWALLIFVVTALLIVGAAPHEVFLRALSMPGPAILYCICGPIFVLSLYHHFGWKAPFRISSTPKGEPVLPGVFYIVEDIVAVNARGGRPFREGMAARYKASPMFRKMMRDQSWFWSIGGLVMAAICTVVVLINPVPAPVAYGIGWAVPFIWAGIWGAITLSWVRSVLRKEKETWKEETEIMKSTMPKALREGNSIEGSSSAMTQV